MAHVMHNVLEPPFLYNFLLINLADGVVGHQTRFVRPICPWLLVVNDICDFIIVRSWAVLFDMVAPAFLRHSRHLQSFQDSLKLLDFVLELFSNVGVEIVGINLATVPHTVAESAID